MKKVLSLILALSLVMILGTVSFAEGNTDITDPGVPGAPAVNVDTATYDEPVTIIDEGAAGGSVDGGNLNEAVPGGEALPKTGGIPAETFYAAGALIVLAALIISRKKVKATSKN